VIIQRVEHPEWLSNAYLVAEGPRGPRCLHRQQRTDGGPGRSRRERPHHDHARPLHARPSGPRRRDRGARRLGTACHCSRSRSWPTARRLESGELRIRALYTPGHCEDHLAFLVDRATASPPTCSSAAPSAGTSAPDGDLAKLKHSILDVLLGLDDETQVFPATRRRPPSETSVARTRSSARGSTAKGSSASRAA
jgi:glyoxylase-like metal-dependent hydrolase (beta-lactamase superfamily II)